MTLAPGPDIVIAGAARSGTSFLAAGLGIHPSIDPGAVKEPEYYGRNFHRGAEWYEQLYSSRSQGLLRLDASMSYTNPTYPEALSRLAAASPHAFLIYAVRDPLHRALSHYRLVRQYFAREDAETFGEALATNPVYLGAGDYRRWLDEIYSLFPPERVLVTPFDVTTRGNELIEVVCGQLGLPPVLPDREDVEDHRNEVVEFRSQLFLKARRTMIRSGAYPWVRRHLGARRMRRIRALATREPSGLTMAEALATCSPAQLQQLRQLNRDAAEAVREALAAQDRRLDLTWASSWRLTSEDQLDTALAASHARPD
jgi:hypothetical protein